MNSLCAPAALVLFAAMSSCAPQDVLAAPQDGLTTIFDGRTLGGWVTRGGHYDGDAAWTVEGGALVGRQKDGQGGLIYTAVPYTEFVLRLEAQLDWPFDSGIFLRMAPQGKGAQVTLDHRPEGEIGAIYSDGFLRHNADGIRLWKKGEWNDIEVRCTGERLRVAVQLNGEPLVDYELPPDATGYAPTGLIGLQVHGDRNDPPANACRFRNIRLRELSKTSSAHFAEGERGILRVTPWGQANGWRALFDGQSLAGWEEAGGAGGWAAAEGVLSALATGKSTCLRTVDDFQDFELRLDFKISEMANSGVFLRGDRQSGDPAWTGMEVQILDEFHWEERTKSKLKPWQHTGSLYGSVPPAVPALKPLGEWNALEIRLQGTRVATKLNGALLYDVDGQDVAVPDGRTPLAKRSPRGFIGLQRHAPASVQGDAYAWFRNCFVRPL